MHVYKRFLSNMIYNIYLYKVYQSAMKPGQDFGIFEVKSFYKVLYSTNHGLKLDIEKGLIIKQY
jgi:hypothetical protein